EGLIEKLRDGIKNDYFEQLLENHLVRNSHGLLAVISPKRGLGEEMENQRREKLKKTRETMTEVDIERLVSDTRDLEVYQRMEDSPEDLLRIPLISRKDLEKKAEHLPVIERNLNGEKIIYFPQETNQIVYLKLFFDTKGVSEELIPYLQVLATLLADIDTKNFSYEKLDTQINLHTGGLHFSADAYIRNDDSTHVFPKFIVSGKSKISKLENLVELILEILNFSDYSNKNRVRTLIMQLGSRLESAINSSGLQISISRLSSYFSEFGAYNEMISGLSYMKFIFQLVRDFDDKYEEIISKLKKVSSSVFCRNNLTIAVSAVDEDYSTVQDRLSSLICGFEAGTEMSAPYSLRPKVKNEGLLSSSQVQYVVQGASFKRLGYEFSGKLRVLEQVLSGEFLHKEIREKGGAYGAYVSFQRNGLFYFGSYMDPCLSSTLDSYRQAPLFLRNLFLDSREMDRYVIGTIAKIDHPRTNSQKAAQAFDQYLMGRSQEDIQKERDEILSVTAGDIRVCADMVESLVEAGAICVFGNEKVILDERALFGELIKIMD
ncbi:MAG: insulinase family protein, partial [Oligoflexales bacterium]|nr:insulinase family protein [Oligoflexales bacterium]